jgi:hypothetical protein
MTARRRDEKNTTAGAALGALALVALIGAGCSNAPDKTSSATASSAGGSASADV